MILIYYFIEFDKMASTEEKSDNIPPIGHEAHPNIEVLDTECVLIRNALTFEEQVRLCEYIEKRDKTPTNQPQAMVPAPKTLVLGENGHPQVQYKFGDVSVVNSMIEKSSDILKQKHLNLMSGFDVCQYKSLSMATIRYEAPDGCFPPHVDHCNNSFVFLTSLGRTANFMIKGPSMDIKKDFKFYSGDVLVFDASTKAGLLHSVVSIDNSASKVGDALASKFPVLYKHRLGVQCRMFF